MSKSSKRPMKSYFNAKSAADYRRQRNRESSGQPLSQKSEILASSPMRRAAARQGE